MPSVGSLTPASRAQEATSEATWEGLVNGGLTLLPSMGAVYVAMQQSPAFRAKTNWQSRTALVIMPALFVFGLTSEKKLEHKMKSIAQETRHREETVHWAEQRHRQMAESREAARDDLNRMQQASASDFDEELQLSNLYKQSVENSGVRIVPGDQLSFYHVAANYTARNPIKVLAAMAVPSVGWIFYGRTGKQHLDFSVKLLHTRVFGQFATISLLLSVMGFKEYMDQQGTFITQAEADQRVEEMKRVRANLLDRLELERERRLANQREVAAAHEQDVKDHNVHYKAHQHHKKKKQGRVVDASSSSSSTENTLRD